MSGMPTIPQHFLLWYLTFTGPAPLLVTLAQLGRRGLHFCIIICLTVVWCNSWLITWWCLSLSHGQPRKFHQLWISADLNNWKLCNNKIAFDSFKWEIIINRYQWWVLMSRMMMMIIQYSTETQLFVIVFRGYMMTFRLEIRNVRILGGWLICLCWAAWVVVTGHGTERWAVWCQEWVSWPVSCSVERRHTQGKHLLTKTHFFSFWKIKIINK